MCSTRTITFSDGFSSASAPTGVDGISNWVTAQAYLVSDVVIQGSKIYECLIAHTAGVFATDLAAVKWGEISQGAVDHTALSNIGTNTHAQIDTHLANTSNPHSVTKSQVGLGNCDNTSDANKPISSATQTALNALNPMTTGGDIIYGGASGVPTRLPNGSAGQFLTSSGSTSAPTWSTLPGANAFNAISNLGFTTSVGSNALTITLKDSAGATPSGTTIIGFRSSTLTSGAYVTRTVSAATSIVVSSGSTLGHTSAVAKNIWLYAIDNAGTVELAVSSNIFDESYLYTTTAEGGAGAADSEHVLYSTTARSNVAIRLIGRMLSTQSTAGTWAAVPTNSSVISGDMQRIVASAGTSAGASISNGATTIIDFTNKILESSNSITTGASWKFTAPYNGAYLVMSDIRYANSAAWTLGSYAGIAIYKNGSAYSNQDCCIQASNTLGTGPTVGIKAIVNLAATEYVDIRASHGESSARSLLASGSYNRVTIMWLGDY